MVMADGSETRRPAVNETMLLWVIDALGPSDVWQIKARLEVNGLLYDEADLRGVIEQLADDGLVHIGIRDNHGLHREIKLTTSGRYLTLQDSISRRTERLETTLERVFIANLALLLVSCWAAGGALAVVPGVLVCSLLALGTLVFYTGSVRKLQDDVATLVVEAREQHKLRDAAINDMVAEVTRRVREAMTPVAPLNVQAENTMEGADGSVAAK